MMHWSQFFALSSGTTSDSEHGMCSVWTVQKRGEKVRGWWKAWKSAFIALWFNLRGKLRRKGPLTTSDRILMLVAKKEKAPNWRRRR